MGGGSRPETVGAALCPTSPRGHAGIVLSVSSHEMKGGESSPTCGFKQNTTKNVPRAGTETRMPTRGAGVGTGVCAPPAFGTEGARDVGAGTAAWVYGGSMVGSDRLDVPAIDNVCMGVWGGGGGGGGQG